MEEEEVETDPASYKTKAVNQKTITFSYQCIPKDTTQTNSYLFLEGGTHGPMSFFIAITFARR